MTLPIRYSDEALSEIDGHYQSFETIQAGLGDRLLLEIEAELGRAADHPEIGPVYWGEFRKLRPHHYKLLLLYRAVPGAIELAAVIDGRMDPKHIRRILKRR